MNKQVPISLRFPMQIWKLRCDPFSGWIGLELRDKASQRAGYYAFSLGGVASQEVGESPIFHTREGYWAGLEEVVDTVLLVHGYASQDLPMHQGVTAISVEGKHLWELPERIFMGLTSQGILVARQVDLAGPLEEISSQSGKVLREFKDRESASLQTDQAQWQEKRESHMTFPGLVPPSEMEHWQSETRERYPGKRLLQVERVEKGAISIHSLAFISPEGTTDQFLEIRETGQLVQQIPLTQNAQGVPLDTFFLLDNRLIYLREGTELGIMEIKTGA